MRVSRPLPTPPKRPGSTSRCPTGLTASAGRNSYSSSDYQARPQRLASRWGPILADPDTRAFFYSLMSEVVAVGRARGVPIPENFAEDRMKFAETSPPTFKASMLHDLERGNRLELDWLAGKVVEFARPLGIPTPANNAVYAMLKLHRMGNARA
ncbi:MULTISPECIES: ketopantoate reductase family protein [Bradyrhizobium]|uniref:ketopantoate reductase family protein n=1 Tax=Bradyrhizobium TaxID=374 RepID=UPI00351786CE